MKKKMTYKVQIMAVTTLLLWQTLLSYGQNAPVKMTFLGREPFESEYNTAQYQCHLSESDDIAATAHVESFRTVWTRNDANENVDPPAPVWIDDNIYKHWKVTLDNYGNNDAFGVFGCEAALDGRISTSISGIFMRSDADIVPSDDLVSVTANAGDTGVSIGMKSTGSKNVADFRWSKDNVRNNDFNGDDTWVISGQVEVDDAGVYECHIQGERSDAKQGLKLLIVRACPAHRWGPDACGGICDNCYNGGICDENSGKCICAPGFKGANCEEGCGGNRYGDTCEKKCYSTDIHDKCSTYLFCLAHPYGCSCNTGWKGLDCFTACDPGTYGASCLQTCHCQSGQCDRYTGVCTGLPPGCSSGSTGTNCQVPDVCTTDYYGSTCTDKCHCMGNVACDKITGECPNQSCAPGYKVHMGQVNCEECLGPRFGEDCADDCHCSESYCNKVTGSCSGGCNPEWVELFPPNLCQTGLIDAAYTRRNPGVTVPVTCTAVKGLNPTDINQLNFVLSRHHENLDDIGISFVQSSDEATTRTAAFLVDNVTDGQTLYCQLRKDGQKYAVYNVTIDVFDLPLLQSAPKADLITDSTITISWSAWDLETEDGDPPVIGYTPYYKMESGQHWLQGASTSGMTLNFTFTALIPEETYLFSVAAVREGDRGEGPRSPDLAVKTCEDTNECCIDPCMNGGTCVDSINMFLCTCPLGFEGDICENNTNECYSDPCMNGGTCIDSMDMFLCSCPLGFEGGFCENNTNECYSDPCMNGGTCIDSINLFLCTCPLLFVGVYCENDKPAEEIETILSGIADDTGGINMTDEEVKMFADAVQEATSDGEFLAEDPTRIEITVSALESVVREGVSSVEVTESVIRAVNNLIEVDGDVRDNVMDVGGRIVEALEKQLRNYKENEGNFSQIYEDIGVVSINVEPSNVGGSLNFAHVLEDSSTRNLTVGLRGGTNKIYGDVRNVPLEQVITSISLPPEVLKLLVGADGKVPISFIIYNSDALFTPSKPTSRNSVNGDDDDDDDRDKYSNSSISERIVSQIISTIIATGDKDDDEDNGGAIDIPVHNPIISTFFIMENLDEREEKLDSSCVVWLYNEDTDEGFWSDESCDMLSDDLDLTVCSCKHTGSFAVLIRVGPLEPEIALYYITLIGSIISGMCLIVCIVTFLSIKSLRSKQPTQIHINLCLSLLGFYIAFLVGPLAVGKKQQCAAVSTIIQFFCLATLAWMSAEALNMYYLFLKAKKGSIRYFTPISCIVAYGSSFTCVILVAFLDRSTDYGTANYCFIHPGYALYFGFLAEVGAMFVLNLIIFVMVIWKVLCRPVMVSKAKEHAKRNEIMTRIRHGVSFWFVLGLSWIFGFLAAVDQSTLIFDYLYCIFIALQGFLMFLLLCVANPDFRKMFSIQKRSESSQSSNVCPSTVNSISESNQCEISGKKNIIKTSNC